jgi:hypothetical protein
MLIGKMLADFPIEVKTLFILLSHEYVRPESALVLITLILYIYGTLVLFL